MIRKQGSVPCFFVVWCGVGARGHNFSCFDTSRLRVSMQKEVYVTSRGTIYTVKYLPIDRLLVTQPKPLYEGTVMVYVEKMRERPHDDFGIVEVSQIRQHPGLYEIRDGLYKFCAAIITGRSELLCAIVDVEE